MLVPPLTPTSPRRPRGALIPPSIGNPARQPREQPLPEALAQGLVFDALHHVVGKSVGEHSFCLVGANAAGPKVENRFAIDLADRGAVRALDVVGKDFKLRLGVDN